MRTKIEPIRSRIEVGVPPEKAFRVFTEEMGTWWPLETHSRAAVERDDVRAERIELEGRAGGRVLEHLSNGEVLPWAEVIVWEPPHRLVLAWRPHGRPQPPTEVEVAFTPRDGGTLVELEHRGWERLTGEFQELYESYTQGWVGTLERFASAALRRPSP
jgi:uncharacterized protein YndB with AHSA1/START domain